MGSLFPILVLHLVLTALPGAAAALLAARLGVRSVPVLLATALGAGAALAMLAFWAFYADRAIGESFSYFALFGSALAIAWALYEGVERALLRRLATPLALWALASLFLVFLGFVHGGTGAPIEAASTRFYGPLPSDNDIPYHFANWYFANGHSGHPTFPPDWLASDRPLLQTGYSLSQWLSGWRDGELDYQVLGVVLQQLWVVGLWALLLAARVGRLTRALVMAAVLVSDVAIVNGFFVWPKMLPTALLLAAAALVLTPLWEELRGRAWAAALLGALAGLAMMAHGGSVFGIVPLGLVAAYRGLPSWRWLGVAVLAGVIVVAPWSAYQRWGEPPGDRLLKYQLAGVTELDGRSFGQTFIDAYDEAGLGGAIHNKGQNFVTMAGGGPWWGHAKAAVEALEAGDSANPLREVRASLFYNLLPALGLLLIAPLLMLIARRRSRENPAEWSLALACLAAVGVGSIFWGLVMFGNESSRAILHQGSFLLPVLAFVGAACGLRAVLPRFAACLIAVNATLMLAVYVPAVDPPPGTSYSFAAALLAAVGLAGFLALALRAPSVGGLAAAANPPAAAR
jgi:hypothetical protein